MVLLIPTGDDAEENDTVYLYWGRNGRVWCCRSLLGTMLKRITLCISTGDGVVGNWAIDLYWGRNGRVWCC